MIIRTRRRRFVILVAFHALAWGASGYFLYAANSGDRGLAAKREAKIKTEEIAGKIALVKAERAQWERRVAQMQGQEIDRDLLDERLRLVLNSAHKNELVILVNRD